MNRLLRADPKIIVGILAAALMTVAYIVGGLLSDRDEIIAAQESIIAGQQETNARLHRVNVALEHRNELRAHQLCESVNEPRQVVATILDELAAPRADDVTGEHEARMRLREQVDPHVQPHECPPRPEEP